METVRLRKLSQIQERVVRACDSCRIKKTKCNGLKPCSRCIQDNKICVFSEKKKLKEKTHPSGYVELLETRLDLVTKALEKVVLLARPSVSFLDEMVTAYQEQWEDGARIAASVDLADKSSILSASKEFAQHRLDHTYINRHQESSPLPSSVKVEEEENHFIDTPVHQNALFRQPREETAAVSASSLTEQLSCLDNNFTLGGFSSGRYKLSTGMSANDGSTSTANEQFSNLINGGINSTTTSPSMANFHNDYTNYLDVDSDSNSTYSNNMMSLNINSSSSVPTSTGPLTTSLFDPNFHKETGGSKKSISLFISSKHMDSNQLTLNHQNSNGSLSSLTYRFETHGLESPGSATSPQNGSNDQFVSSSEAANTKRSLSLSRASSIHKLKSNGHIQKAGHANNNHATVQRRLSNVFSAHQQHLQQQQPTSNGSQNLFSSGASSTESSTPNAQYMLPGTTASTPVSILNPDSAKTSEGLLNGVLNDFDNELSTFTSLPSDALKVNGGNQLYIPSSLEVRNTPYGMNGLDVMEGEGFDLFLSGFTGLCTQ
ncbi:Fluconazole resistance protein 1 [Scheffersomyces spartinae]|uniref:Fluconazole resistance protein 1 n=1 Tax=Scheffersomyces spartinae TaxID=45513 RepID=A0A9P7V8I5_9ASCO|nr:Fluconazole resistance protein 1 [Scheffersomyces spartinae]KAG7192816.1 Fluconazole resistance protein 1 [Scheffersomyces spartinae]